MRRITLGRNSEEMGAILPPHAIIIYQAHVGFVHQSRRLQAMPSLIQPVSDFTTPLQLRLRRPISGATSAGTNPVLNPRTTKGRNNKPVVRILNLLDLLGFLTAGLGY